MTTDYRQSIGVTRVPDFPNVLLITSDQHHHRAQRVAGGEEVDRAQQVARGAGEERHRRTIGAHHANAQQALAR